MAALDAWDVSKQRRLEEDKRRAVEDARRRDEDRQRQAEGAPCVFVYVCAALTRDVIQMKSFVRRWKTRGPSWRTTGDSWRQSARSKPRCALWTSKPGVSPML